MIATSLAEEQSTEPWDLESLKQAPAYRWLDDKSPIRSLLYENHPIDGTPTEVFAFYATPGTISGDPSRDKDLPAVVLIHGGGGTAFAEWTWLWAKRGYAAIAMDLSGRQPDAPQFDPESGELIVGNHGRIERRRLEHGGPEHGGTEKFANVGGDLSDDWQYHAVAAVIRAHSLIRSFDEVDADRTAVTGISWGGYLTCLTASLDDRFKAAVPVYGCGFLYEGESVQKPQIDRLSDEKRAEWIRIYEPSAWLTRCRVPILFVNGTNDPHYPLDSYLRSYEAVPGVKQMRIEVNMRHSHIHGWKPEEIGLFIDQYVRDGAPLPMIGDVREEDGRVVAKFHSALPVGAVKLHYTTDDGPLVKRTWHTVDAHRKGPLTMSAVLPEGVTIWLFSVTDERGAMTTTPPQFTDAQ